MRSSPSTEARSAVRAVVSTERVHTAVAGVGALSHWTEVTPEEGADLVRAELFGAAVTLPLVWLLDRIVAPVVTWRSAELERRLERGQGPVLSRAALAGQLREGRDAERPAVLSVEAFVAVQPMRQALGAMGWLAGYAAAAVALPAPPGSADWDVFECDYRGYTVAEVSPHHARIKVLGSLVGRSAHRPVNHHLRLLQEQLFDVAVRHDRLPAG